MKKSYIIHFIVGLILVLMPVSITFFNTYQKTPPGMTWSPLNSQDKLCTDSRFYFASVAERSDHFWTHTNPVSDNHKAFLIDKFRMASYQMMSVLTLGASDPRVAFVLSFLLSFTITFTALYLCCYLIGLSAFQSLVTSWSVFYLTGLYYLISQGYFPYLASNFQLTVLNSSLTSGIEQINDSFRYLALSGVNFFTWISLALLLYFNNRPQKKLLLLLVPLVAIIPYTYVSTTVFITAIYLGYFILNFRNSRIRNLLLMAVAIALVILVFTGFYGDLFQLAKQGTDMVGEAHFGQRKEFSLFGFFSFFKSVFYLILPLMILIFLNKRTVFYKICLSFCIGLLLIAIACFGLQSEEIFTRMMNRGGAYIWFYFVFSGIFLLVGKTSKSRLKLFGSVFFILLLFVQSFTLGQNLSRTYIDNQMFYLSEDRWLVFDFLRKHVKPGELIFGTDVRDIQLLPAMTSLHLVTAGAEYLEKPHTQIAKYAQGLRYLGLPTEFLIEQLNKYIVNDGLTSCLSTHNKIPPEEVGTYNLFKQLLYDPYSKTFNGVRIRNDLGDHLSSEFINEFKTQVGSDENAGWVEDVDYWLISTNLFEDAIKAGQRRNLKVIYSNKNFVLLKK